MDHRDLIAADRILPDRVGEIYYLRYNPEQRWYAIRSIRQSLLTPLQVLGGKPDVIRAIRVRDV